MSSGEVERFAQAAAEAFEGELVAEPLEPGDQFLQAVHDVVGPQTYCSSAGQTELDARAAAARALLTSRAAGRAGEPSFAGASCDAVHIARAIARDVGSQPLVEVAAASAWIFAG